MGDTPNLAIRNGMIVRQYVAGQTLRALAVEFKLSTTSISNVIARAGWPERVGKSSDLIPRAILALRSRSQWSETLLYQLGAKLGVDKAGIRDILARPFMDERPKPAIAKPTKSDAPKHLTCPVCGVRKQDGLSCDGCFVDDAREAE